MKSTAKSTTPPPRGTEKNRSAVRPEDPRAVGARLRLIRTALLGYTTYKQIAEKLKIAENRWGNYERGLPFPQPQALKLIKLVPGLDLDYIYRGTMDAAGGLSYDLARKLSAAAENDTTDD